MLYGFEEIVVASVPPALPLISLSVLDQKRACYSLDCDMAWAAPFMAHGVAPTPQPPPAHAFASAYEHAMAMREYEVWKFGCYCELNYCGTAKQLKSSY